MPSILPWKKSCQGHKSSLWSHIWRTPFWSQVTWPLSNIRHFDHFLLFETRLELRFSELVWHCSILVSSYISQSDFLAPPPLINLSQDFSEFNSLPSLLCVPSSQVISSLFHSFKYYLYAFNLPIYICNPELSSEFQDEYPHLNVSQASQTKYMQNRILHIPQKPAYPPIFLRK